MVRNGPKWSETRDEWKKRDEKRKYGGGGSVEFQWAHRLVQDCTQVGRQFARANKLRREAPNICMSIAWNTIHINLQEHRIFRWFVDFWEIRASLH
jgi:hypothetical protein